MAALAALIAPARAQVAFEAAQSIYVSGRPQFIAVGDFNGDGRTDLAVVLEQRAVVEILLAQDGGTFRPGGDYPLAGLHTSSISVGDVDGDGHLDLVVTDAGSGIAHVTHPTGPTFSVLLGKGDGTFLPRADYSSPDGTGFALLGDLNGDGRPDLVVSGRYADKVGVRLNNGEGRFRARVDYPAGAAYVGFAAAGDFNGDGHADLLVVGVDGAIYVLAGHGDGTFAAPPAAPPDSSPSSSSPRSVALGDFDGDHRLDIAIVTFAGAVSLLLGQSDGTFIDAGVVAVLPDFAYQASLVAGDFNNDGRLDLAVLYSRKDSEIGVAAVLIGKGDGTFADPVSYAAGENPGALAVGDFNGDGHLDLVAANSDSDNLSVLWGNGDGTFRGKPARTLVGRFAEAAAAADFNGDGKLDVAVVTQNRLGDPGSVTVLNGKGDGTFEDGVVYDVGVKPAFLLARDLDGDGRIDLAVSNEISDTVTVWKGAAGGGFDRAATYPVGKSPGWLAVGDFNGDGRLDLAVANRDDATIGMLFGQRDGTFGAGVAVRLSGPPQSMVAADFNGDGRLDLAVAGGMNGGVSVLLGRGDGSFDPQAEYPVAAGLPSIVAADFHGDGKIDLAVADYEGGKVHVLLGGGDGTFHAGAEYLAGNSPESIAVADLNGDGRADLAVANFGSDTATVLLGNGDGTFRAGGDFTTGADPRSIVAGDFDGDGRLDLAVANGSYDSTQGNVLVLLNRPPLPSMPNLPPALPGDLNGDGRVDFKDVTLLLGFVIGAAAPTPAQAAAGDLNGDGKLTLQDATLLLRKAVGL